MTTRRTALQWVGTALGAAWNARVMGQGLRPGAAGENPAPSPFSVMPAGGWFPPGEALTASPNRDRLSHGTGPQVDTPHGSAWRHRALRGIAPNRFVLVDEGPATHLRVEVNGSASALVARLPGGVRGETLRWRWRADAFPERAAFGIREADDFAARVYLMFDLPDSRLSWSDRLVLRSAALLQGEPVPAVTLVYLLHAGDARAEPLLSPFSDRVAMFVARSHARPGLWYGETRLWKQDFERAFGIRYPGAIPMPFAIAVGADGDQTGARFNSAFGDMVFE